MMTTWEFWRGRVWSPDLVRQSPIAWQACAIVALALAVRLALLPLASHETLDQAARVFIAWRWADDPFLLLHGIWPPLHFLLLGTVLRLFPDPIMAPVWLHLLLGCATPAVVYLVTHRLFGSPRAALAVGVAFALYPIAIRDSLSVLAQTPFVLLVALSMLALVNARGRTGDWRHALAAGFALTLASALRYEGWMLTPFFAVLLCRQPRRALIFLLAAVAWPLVSMSANWLQYGDPLFGVHAAAYHELYNAGKASFTLAERAALPLVLAKGLVGGMTPLLTLLIGLGVMDSLVRRRPQAIWLFPAAGLGAMMLTAAARGTLVPKAIYTETFGLLLLPFLAAFLTSAPVRRLAPRGVTALHVALFGSMLALLILGTLRDTPGFRQDYRLLAAIPAVGPVPRLRQQATVDELATVVNAFRAHRGGALVLDSLDSPASGYLALHSGYHPDRIFLAPGSPNKNLNTRIPDERRDLRARNQPLLGANPPHLDEFLQENCQGILLLRPGSRVASLLHYRATPQASVDGIYIRLWELHRVQWSATPDSRLENGGLVGPARGEVVVLRYQLETCPGDAKQTS